MSTSLGDLVTDTQTRLGDAAGQVWTHDEIVVQIQEAYGLLAQTRAVFWDTTFSENLPTSFTYTQPWEARDGFVAVDAGVANYTFTDEQGLSDNQAKEVGPAWFTCPDEIAWLADVGANTAISATDELPASLRALDRVVWNNQTIVALSPRHLRAGDSRFQYTAGEVYAYLWRYDGVRTFRKVRVPAAQAATADVTGSWGLLRDPTDLSGDTVTGSWGIPRRIPGHLATGPYAWGAPRRPFLETNNVRIEHTRSGRALVTDTDLCELPDRYASYLRDYAQWQLLEKPGPGQDLALAAHYQARWTRDLARIDGRLQRVTQERVSVLGGDGRPSITRPPRPSRPWAYGQEVDA